MREKWLVLGLLSAATACQASVQASAQAQAGPGEAEGDEPLGAASVEGRSDQQVAGETALLGARHDLALVGDRPTPTCTCLAVAAGYPNNPTFFWSSIVPTIDVSSQLVIAFTSDGITCPVEAKDSLGASYWGYRVVNDDVVVVVERAEFGRPVTNGAIIPKPAAGGSVYVEPLDAKVPYGRPLDGQGKRCRVDSSVAVQRAVPLPPEPSTKQ